jgi:hypothetical protein
MSQQAPDNIFCLSNALVNDKIDKSDLNLNAIKQYIRDNTVLTANISQFINDRDTMAFQYLRLQPKHIEKQPLYGSNAPSTTALELSVCPAKQLDDGKWVPDESNIIFSALISERSLCDAIFNTARSEITPMTFTQLNGFSLKRPAPRFSVKEQYSTHFYKANDDALDNLNIAIGEAKLLQNTDTKLNKTTKGKISNAVEQLSRYTRADLNFDLELDGEQLDKDMHHVKTEVFSALTNKLVNISTPLALPNPDQKGQGLLQDFFDLFCDIESKQDVGTLLERFAPTHGTGDWRDSEVQKSILYQANRYLNPHIRDLNKGGDYGKGGISLHDVSGTPRYFFGDARQVNRFFEMRIQFTAERQDTFGEIKIDDLTTFMTLQLTNYQMMELMQSSLGGQWVKTTCNRFMGRSIKVPEDDNKNHDNKTAIKVEKPVENQTLAKWVSELQTLLAGNSQAKATRERILQIILHIKTLIDEELPKREACYEAARGTLQQQYQEDTTAQLEAVFNKVGEAHPHLKQEIQALLSTSEVDKT